MASLNKVHLIGNLTRDPELKHTPKGTAVAEIGLALNRVWYDDNKQKQEDVTFVDVTLWGKTGEIAAQYLSKGSAVYIEGRLHLETWDDKETGKKRSKLKIVGESMQFLDSKKSDSPPRSPNQNGATPPKKDSWEEFDKEDDSIPF